MVGKAVFNEIAAVLLTRPGHHQLLGREFQKSRGMALGVALFGLFYLAFVFAVARRWRWFVAVAVPGLLADALLTVQWPVAVVFLTLLLVPSTRRQLLGATQPRSEVPS
jgi:hypothetical protein